MTRCWRRRIASSRRLRAARRSWRSSSSDGVSSTPRRIGVMDPLLVSVRAGPRRASVIISFNLLRDPSGQWLRSPACRLRCSPCTTRPGSATSPSRCTASDGGSCRAEGPPRRSPSAACPSPMSPSSPVFRRSSTTASSRCIRRSTAACWPTRPSPSTRPTWRRTASSRSRSSSPTCTRSRRSPGIELIDIGGPAMVRASAKNHAHVAIVVDPVDYEPVLAEIAELGDGHAATRRRLARDAFAHTAAYDAAIVSWFDASETEPEAAAARRCTSPSSGPTSCATARTRTSRERATGSPAPTAGGTRWCSTAARR